MLKTFGGRCFLGSVGMAAFCAAKALLPRPGETTLFFCVASAAWVALAVFWWREFREGE